jgi:UrcA family protein
MYTKRAATAAQSLFRCAAVCGTLFAASAAAADQHDVTVTIRVSTQGLDLSRSADAQAFYARLKNAAWVACTRADRAGLVPVDDVNRCVETSLAGAIRTAKTPTLTRMYIATHTPQQVVAHGMRLDPDERWELTMYGPAPPNKK